MRPKITDYLPPKMLTQHQMNQNYEVYRRVYETTREYQQRLNAMPLTMFNTLPYTAQVQYYNARLEEEYIAKSNDNETSE